jgi:hypothetical protein
LGRGGLGHALRRLIPAFDRRRRAGQFGRMLFLSLDGGSEMSYRLPQQLHAEQDRAA